MVRLRVRLNFLNCLDNNVQTFAATAIQHNILRWWGFGFLRWWGDNLLHLIKHHTLRVPSSQKSSRHYLSSWWNSFSFIVSYKYFTFPRAPIHWLNCRFVFGVYCQIHVSLKLMNNRRKTVLLRWIMSKPSRETSIRMGFWSTDSRRGTDRTETFFVCGYSCSCILWALSVEITAMPVSWRSLLIDFQHGINNYFNDLLNLQWILGDWTFIDKYEGTTTVKLCNILNM